jgi:hypothetical protein
MDNQLYHSLAAWLVNRADPVDNLLLSDNEAMKHLI